MFSVTAIIKAKKGHENTIKQALLDVAAHVSSVIIDGNIVMKERVLLSMDIEQIKADLNQRLPAIMDRFEKAMA